MKKVLFLIVFFTGSFLSQGQEADCNLPSFIFGDITGEPGTVVSMPISVRNYNDIASFQYTITFDNTLLRYVGCNDELLTDVLDCTNLGTNPDELDRGIIRILWLDVNGVNYSHPDDTELLSLDFEIIGNCGSTGAIEKTGQPLLEELVYEDATSGESIVLPLICYTPSTVNITCSSIAINDSYCHPSVGENDGRIRFSPCCGTGPYSYSVNGGTPSTVSENGVIPLDNLGPGSYTITVTDANNASTSTTITLIEGADLSLNVETTLPRCATSEISDGKIKAIATGGTAPYRYQWSTTTANVDSLIGLSNGNYSITVTDGTGCMDTVDVELAQDSLMLEMTVIQNAKCEGVASGIIQFVGSGGQPRDLNGNPTYGFQILRNGVPYANQNFLDDTLLLTSFEGGAGIYEAYLYGDAFTQRACRTDTFPINIPYDKELVLDINTTAPLCNGQANGSIDIELLSNGRNLSPDFNFQIDTLGGGSFQNTQASTNFSFENLAGNSYTITIQEEAPNTNGRSCAIDTVITIMDPDPITITTNTISQVSCDSGGNDGAIDISATGGTGTLSYEWSDDASISSNVRTNLSPSIYIVTVTDQNSCSNTARFDLQSGGNIQISDISVSHLECNGDANGQITITTNPSNVTFIWEDDNSLNTGTRTNLNGGTYRVTVSDGMGCDIPQTIVVNEPTAITYTINDILPTCVQDSNGSLSVVVSGGETGTSGGYTYQWNHPNDVGTATLASIPSGDYEVTITDDNNCQLIETITLAPQDSVLVVVDNILGITCGGTADGSARATASGGPNGSTDYTFIWSSMETGFGPSDTAEFLEEGEQWVIASDGLCNSDTIPFTIASGQQISLDQTNSTIVDPTCFGDTNGSATLVATGGRAPYTFEWRDLGITNSTVTGLGAGVYEVFVTDASDCTSRLAVTISDPDEFVVRVDSINSNGMMCTTTGIQQGTIRVLVEGGNPGPIVYNWTDNVSTTNIASELNAGLYSIRVEDSRGCLAETEYLVAEVEPLVVDMPQPMDLNCAGETTCVTVSSVSGGSGMGYQFGTGFNTNTEIGDCLFLPAGNHNIRVEDSEGCAEIIPITIVEPLELSVNIGGDKSISIGQSDIIDITGKINTSVGLDMVFWTPEDNIECVAGTNCQRIEVSPSETTTYTVTVVDQNGCTATDDVVVTVSNERLVYIPNAFSPDNADVDDNKLFTVFGGPGVQSIERMEVFDRWGNRLFLGVPNGLNPNPLEVSWDGRSKGQKQKPGVYVYVLEVSFIDNTRQVYTGNVTLF